VPTRRCPPTDVQLDHVPLYELILQRAPSTPRAATVKLLFVAATVGSDVKFAPRDVDADHAVPSQCFHQRALSLPRTKRSMLFAPREHTAGAPAIATPYLLGSPRGPDANEQGWKDTIRMNPGEVTVVKVRFAPTDGSPSYPFDARLGPGYVWHCHIVDHEDNEMMRPYLVV